MLKTVGSLWQSQDPGWLSHLHPEVRALTQPGGKRALQTDEGMPRGALWSLGMGQLLSAYHLPQQLDTRGSADDKKSEMKERQ